MNNIQYLTLKNKIISNYVPFTLTPPEQIVDIPITDTMITGMKKYVTSSIVLPIELGESPLYISNCLYCQTYYVDTDYPCEDCPMKLAGNRCYSLNSTWRQCNNAIRELDIKSLTNLTNELVDLAKAFINAHTKDTK